MNTQSKISHFLFHSTPTEKGRGGMDHIKHPFRGMRDDLQGRRKCYRQDWINGIRAGYK